MNLKKTLIASAVTATIGMPTLISADTISMDFTGLFGLPSTLGTSLNGNSDAACPGITDPVACDMIGSRTPMTGTISFDTTAGVGSASINPFSFFGNGLLSFSPLSLLDIGDGFGSTAGTLVAAVMTLDWNVSADVPATVILDAAGLFGSIGLPGSSWSVSSGCTGCAISSTPDTIFGHSIGAVPISTTTYNTAGTTLGSLFPLTDDGKPGSPMPTAPLNPHSLTFDFTTINSTSIGPPVPVPAAAWLFGSGLLGLINIARQRKT